MSPDGRVKRPPETSEQLTFIAAGPPTLTSEAAAILLRILLRAVPSSETGSMVRFQKNQNQEK